MERTEENRRSRRDATGWSPVAAAETINGNNLMRLRVHAGRSILALHLLPAPAPIAISLFAWIISDADWLVFKKNKVRISSKKFST